MNGDYERLEATIRDAFDLWKQSNDPADYYGVSLPRFIVDQLVEAGFVPEQSDGNGCA